MHWGQQPVRLSAWRCDQLPTDAPTTSVHIVAFHGERVLVVRDRKGVYGFPGGRLEAGETYEQALAREVYEEARAHLKPHYYLFAVLKIEYTERLPTRVYHHDFSYMGMYVGNVRALEPIGLDPAGIVTARDLFHCDQCTRFLPEHDRILLREALCVVDGRSGCDQRPVRAFTAFRQAGLPA
jgi:8-oxo-dGTP pyrophosphatase MutT (NUDIX family)